MYVLLNFLGSIANYSFITEDAVLNTLALLEIIKAVGSGEAGEALASPDFKPNSNISALTFFSFSSHKYVTIATITYSANI